MLFKTKMQLNHKDIFYKLLRIRMVEEAVAEKYKEQEMRCPVHLSIGQEAVAVAACNFLTNNDYVTSAHRAHAHYLAKGGDLKSMIAEFYGKETGCAAGRGGSMHLIDQNVGFLGCVPIVGSTIAIGVGAAFGAKMQKKNNITVVFFGESATEEGVFYESINFALLHKLPVIFVCENNLYSVITPLEKRRPDDSNFSKIVSGFGMQTYHLDGQNCSALLEGFEEIVSEVRDSQKPIFVECDTYRYLEHCGPNYEVNLRPAKEIEEWTKRDPIDIYTDFLLQNNQITNDEIKDIRDSISQEIVDVFGSVFKDLYPSKDDLTKHIFRDS